MNRRIESRARRGGAFTLVELLIVVAIIAILAAIAVPNFAEVMVRCRVARVKSDLRAISTALEAYRADNSSYPRAELNMSLGRRLAPLTTPIAFIASPATDPFFRVEAEGLGGSGPEYVYASGNIYFGTTAQFDNNQYKGTLYSIAGRGPDGDINVGGYCMAHPIALRNRTGILGSYDPTNGAISPGDILRLGAGTLGSAQ